MIVSSQARYPCSNVIDLDRDMPRPVYLVTECHFSTAHGVMSIFPHG